MFFAYTPTKPPYTVKNGDDFDTLIKDICKYSSAGDLMLCGDFNARTASDPDFIQYDNNDKFIQNDSNYIYDLVIFCRISTDVTTCNRGKRLLEICSQSQLRIANGRSFGDLTGEFISHSTLGSTPVV